MLLLALDVSLRVTAAAAAVALVLLAFRVRSGSVRHAAWSAVLVVMLTMPLLMAVVPEIEVPVPSTPVFDSGAAVRSEGPAREVEAAGERAIAAPAPPARVTAVEPEGRRPSLAIALWLIYGAVSGGLLVRLGAGWLLARRMVRAAARTTVSNRSPVLASTAVASPITTGIVRPVIVLPADWPTWSAFKLRAVLAHENAHIARRDPLIALLAAVNRALFWFHPVAWWLERTLAVSAEHACDERAARDAPDVGAYARVLLEFAEDISARGERVAWQGLGVDGTGLLGTRIERLLRGDAVARMSVLRRVTTALACAAVLVIAIACRQQVAATPLREDPELAKQLADQAAAWTRQKAANDLSLEQVDALEARLETNADDWEAREQLVTYYTAGTKVPWERKVPGLRRHALWITEHHPEGRIPPPALSPEYDPEGFAVARRLWERHLANPDASPFLIYRAAQFFWPYDKATTERLILRGQSIDPRAEALKARMPANVAGYGWDTQLGTLYGAAILGATRPWTRAYEPEHANAPFPQEVRRKLESSTDPRLLIRIAGHIIDARANRERVPEMVELGQRYLNRALELDPTLAPALALRARLDSQAQQERIRSAMTKGTPVADEDRLLYLAQKAQSHYLQLEALSRPPEARRGVVMTDAPTPLTEAQENKAAAKQAANEALALAARHPDRPEAGIAAITAHHTLGLLALSDGDRSAAVRHMIDSVKVAPLEQESPPTMLWLKLTNYLLQEGERDSVIQFFEAYAKISPQNRERLIQDAQAVREGRMPSSYQHMFARPW